MSQLHVVCPHCHTTNRIQASDLGNAPDCGNRHAALFTGQPAAAGRTVTAPQAVVRAGGRPAVAVQGPFASTSSLDAWRADFTIRPRGKRLTLGVGAR